MGLYDTVPMKADLPSSFETDGYGLDLEMKLKYQQSKITLRDGQMRDRAQYFCKNASIFDLTGTKLGWGDIAPADVEKMMGVYYILSEMKSYWLVNMLAVNSMKDSQDPNSISPFRHLLPPEAINIEISYIKKNAIARIADGKIETNKELILKNIQ